MRLLPWSGALWRLRTVEGAACWFRTKPSRDSSIQLFCLSPPGLITGRQETKEPESADEHCLSELESSMSSLQRSYEMPARDGFTVTPFITVADIDRSARYYTRNPDDRGSRRDDFARNLHMARL
jgi:hypothetical protein